ncbi:TetR/AcrR family transcriptional regulator [Allopusillimonas ginsengisoli]|uniref:TetR/AcrR family transcriptional regulator n=1 Tax=Allopusillimonas ginsengisoli TaxID=453575 RepID=UPI00101E949C|nr:TetR/AcrR family transcriptional regulator [Allopusillimonas ginsengisoli]TEA79443.1 TetR/AcrR family transcriptional regulator [Allopusillimonas ginsengisoli]
MAERGRPRNFDRTAALRVAMEMFWEHGYEGTSIADLTSAMGITPPSLYNAFGNKEQLFREAVEFYVARDGGTTARALREGATAYKAIEAMLQAAGSAAQGPDRPRGCLVVLGAANCAQQNKKVDEFLQGYRQGTREAIFHRIRQGQSANELAPDADAGALADFYATVLNGLAVLTRDGASRTSVQAIVRQAMAAWPASA